MKKIFNLENNPKTELLKIDLQMGSVAYPCNVAPLELPKYMFTSVF